MSKSWIATLIVLAWVLSVGPFFVVGLHIDLGIPLVQLLTGGPLLGLFFAASAAYVLWTRKRTPFEAAAWPFAAAAMFVDVAFLGAVLVWGF